MRFLKREEISDGIDSLPDKLGVIRGSDLFGAPKITLFKPFYLREEICNTKVGKT